MNLSTEAEKALTAKQVICFLYNLRKWGLFGLFSGLALGLTIFYYFSSTKYVTQLFIQSPAIEAIDIDSQNTRLQLNRILGNPKHERMIFEVIHSPAKDAGNKTAEYYALKQLQQNPLFSVSSYLGNSEYVFTITLPNKLLRSGFESSLLTKVNLAIKTGLEDLNKQEQQLIEHYTKTTDSIINNFFANNTYKASELKRVKILRNILALETSLFKILESSPKAVKLLQLSDYGFKKTKSNRSWPEISFDTRLAKIARIIAILDSENLIQQSQLVKSRKELVALKSESYKIDYKAFSIKALIETSARNLNLAEPSALLASDTFTGTEVFTFKKDPIIIFEKPIYHKRLLKTLAFTLCGLFLGIFFGAFFEMKRQIP